MKPIVEQMLAAVPTAPDLTKMPPAEARALGEAAARRWPVPDSVSIESVRFPSNNGECGGLLIVPGAVEPKAVILYVHGGGWTFGSAKSYLPLAAGLAVATGATVLSVDYRLAPEHKCPAALDDVLAGWSWLTAMPGRPTAAFMCGDSVGAALCVAAARRSGAGAAPLGIVALYGVFSAFSPDPVDGVEGPHIVTNARMDWFREQYERVSGVDRLDPDFSPLQGRLEGLPPLFIAPAEIDSFHQDSVRLAQAAVEAGVEVEFKLYRGVIHGFMQMASKVAAARMAYADIAGFVAWHTARVA